MTDYYQILGIDRNATESDIKRAYKKLASQHHPDKGGDQEKFKEIQKAYDVLKDPEKRQQYDNPSPFQNGPHGDFDFSHDIFSQFFNMHGNPFQQHTQRRNKDLRVQITVPVASTLAPQQKTVNVQTTKGETFTVHIEIPQGASHGTTIKYTGMGDNFFESLTRGDLYVIINLVVDSRFRIEASNLITTLEINSIEAMLGVEKEIVGIDNKKFLLKIPAGCQYNAKFSLSGQGLCVLNSSIRGNLIVQVIITTPVLDVTQLEKIKELWNSLQ
jgi:DnaJ-class molecular chaperone